MKDTMIGVDLAKRVLTRDQFRAFTAQLPACLVVFEACGSASYWARKMEALGHETKLVAPQYIRPFVKRQKNDANDAEAIVIAARQPEMRFVVPNRRISRHGLPCFADASGWSGADQRCECPAQPAL